MIIYIDTQTLDLTTEGYVPLTDMALVRGDKIPLRIILKNGMGVDTESGDVPVLAVKKSLGNDTLVLAATGLQRVEDALGAAYVGSLVVNTTQLAEAMGDQDRIDLVGEVVLVAPDGAQRTSRLVRVTVRADLLSDEYEPPAEVLADWNNLVDASLAARLPDALHDAGVYLTPVPGEATLTVTGGSLAYALGYYLLPLSAPSVIGHLAGHYSINRLTITAPASHNNGTAWMMRLWRYQDGMMSELGTSTDQATWADTDTSGQQTCTWDFDGVEVAAADVLVMQIYDAAGSSKQMQGYARHVDQAEGMGKCTVSSGVPQITHPCALGIDLDTTYQEGVSVGGTELASKRHFDSLAAEVRDTIPQVNQAADDAGAARDDAQTSMNAALNYAADAADAATAAQQALASIPRVDGAGNMTLAGGLAVAGTVTANGGVRVPLPVTAQEAISYEALITQQAATDWSKMTYYLDDMASSWVTYLIREMQLRWVAVQTANSSMQEGLYSNIMCDLVITMTKAAGISLIGRTTDAWRFSNYMGGSRNSGYSAAATWSIRGSDKVSILLGSTGQGYGSTSNPAAACYTHPIHWSDYQLTGADYRYPLLNTVNGVTYRDMTPAWQVTIYPKGYLGSSTSCLLRGTDYGRDVGDQQYIWALVPSITYLSVAFTPRRVGDHKNVTNRWELFVDAHYVMPMTSLFCGSGHTACLTTKAKAHEVSSTYQVGMRMGGMRIDANPALGGANAWTIMERVVMQGAVINPVPEVTASALEVPAAGGEVTLTVSSTLAEAMYVVNDTMCGHDPAAVWCSQSAEQIPAGGGEVTLTLAPNTTGQPRQVWAFVGHHYAQAAVIKINQLA